MESREVLVCSGRLAGPSTRGTRGFDLRLLGGFGLLAGSRQVLLSPRAQEMVVLLALRPDLDRSQVAGTLWESSTEERALASLRTELWRLNRQAPGCVSCDGRRIGLDPAVRVDVATFVRRGRRVLDRSLVLSLEDVPDPWAGAVLLPAWEHPWLVLERERLRQLRLHVGEVAALRLAETGQHALALECALGVLRLEPTRESAYRTLIAVHLAEGNVAEARRVYARCIDMLERELGAVPTFRPDLTGPPPPAGRGRGRQHSARRPARDATGHGSSRTSAAPR